MHERPRLLFIHIPKTAGSSFSLFLAQHVGTEHCSESIRVMKLQEALARYRDCDLVSGHIYPVAGDKLPRDRASIVILRDPIDRLLSSLYYEKNDVADVPFAREDVRSTHLLSGMLDSLSEAQGDSLNLQSGMISPLGFHEVTEGNVATRITAARRALDEFQFVGIQSELDDFAAMIAKRMGWAHHGTLAHANVTSSRPTKSDLTREHRSRLEQLLAPDIELYNYALDRFRSDRREMILSARIPTSNETLVDIAPARPSPTAGFANVATIPSVREPLDYGSRTVRIRSVMVFGEISGTENVLVGELIHVLVDFESEIQVQDFCVGFSIRNKNGAALHGTNTRLQGGVHDIGVGRFRATFRFFNRIGEGSYLVDVDLHRGAGHNEGHFHTKTAAARLNVVGRIGAYFEGSVLLDVDVSIDPQDSVSAITTRAAEDMLLPTMYLGKLTPELTEFSGRLRQIDDLSRLEAGGGALVNIEVANTSKVTWPANGKRPVHLSYRWYSEVGALIVANGLRTRFSRDIQPGERVLVRGLLRAPEVRGRMFLLWDLLQEHVHWFSEMGLESTAVCDIEIE